MNTFNPTSPVYQRMKRLGRSKLSVKKREGSSR